MWFKHNEKETVAMETNVIFKARINLLIFISEFYKKCLDYPGDSIMLLDFLASHLYCTFSQYDVKKSNQVTFLLLFLVDSQTNTYVRTVGA